MSGTGGGSDRRLIVVSNRLPLVLRRSESGWRTDRSSGGLATALRPMLSGAHGDSGLWIGWPGISIEGDPERAQEIARWQRDEHCVAVELSE